MSRNNKINNKMKKHNAFLIIIILTAIMSSCGSKSMPDDLERKKESINNTLSALGNERENVNGKDIQPLIDKYTAIKNELENYTTECNKRGIEKNNDEAINQINQVIEELKSKIPVLISYAQAESFMQKRCSDIGQTLMKSKTVYFNGTKLYMFLSVAQNGYVCISSISENALEILAADCGPSEIKIEQWNAAN
jgi:hypothetical protein